jgi:hypothetical protein
MSVYLGHRGRIELQRTGQSKIVTNILANHVNADLDRLQLDFGQENGIDLSCPFNNGDEIEFRGPIDAAGNRTLLSFVSASGWSDGNQHGSGKWFVNVDDLGGMRLYSSFEESLAGDTGPSIPLETIANDIDNVELELANNIPRILGRAVSWELNTTRENVDTTVLMDQFRSQWSSLMSGSGRINAQWNYREEVGETGIDISNYFLQLALRTEIGAQFKAQLFLKTPGTGGLNPDGTDDALWYDISGVITQAGVQVSPDALIEVGIDFITTGPIRLLARTISLGLILQENGDDLLLDGLVTGRLLLE